MAQHWLDQDPQAAAEAAKYGTAIPSRVFIIQFLEDWGAPITHDKLCQALSIDDEAITEPLLHRLKAMCRDNQLMSNRKSEFCLIDHLSLISGRIIGHRDGFGFVQPDEGGDDLFLSPKEMRQVFHGDKVLVQQVSVDRRGRPEGKIIEVVERTSHQLVGRFMGEDNAFGELLADNQRITQKVLVVPNKEQPIKYQDQQLVIVEICQYPTKRQMAQAKVVEVLGDHMAAGMEIKVAMAKYEIPHQWPDAVEQAVSSYGVEVEESAKSNRIDLRHLNFCTIDGEDAKDFDDAVYVEVQAEGGWKLWVAIADVSWYVRPESALDVEAQLRGNSVYFPEHVVPMLPEVLSNGLCSLNPKVDRLAMVCEMTIDAEGNLVGHQFHEGLIQSQARLTYSKVGQMLAAEQTAEAQSLRAEYAEIVPQLEILHELYKSLRQAREIRGAIDFETTETRIEFGEGRKIERIVPIQRNDAHKLIEECMLCANVATAQFLSGLKYTSLYRIHNGPKEQKLENLRSYLAELSLTLDGGTDPKPSDYQKLSAQIEGRADQHIIQIMMLRSMQQAVYSADNQGHFGLAYETYAHFTSPIRRYPDLLVHRAIRSVIHMEQSHTGVKRPEQFTPNPEFNYAYSPAQVIQLGENCSLTERRADEATRDVMAWLKTEYMQAHVGDSFKGVVSAVTGFGLFVELSDVFVEGLIHITALPSDYYQFDVAKQRLVGERSGRSFRLGDPLEVQVVRVDLDERKIDFELVEGSHKGRRSERRKTDTNKKDFKAEKDTKMPKKSKKKYAKKGGKNKAKEPVKTTDKKSNKKTKNSQRKAEKKSLARKISDWFSG